MRFYTSEECRTWASGLGLPDSEASFPPDFSSFRCAVPFDRLRRFSREIAAALQDFDSCLLEVTASGIWPSTENLHLYYRLRQSYGDARLLEEAPGHLFLTYEFEDLATFVQVCLMFLWDARLLTNADYLRVELSHDEFVEFHSRDTNLLEGVRTGLEAAGIEMRG